MCLCSNNKLPTKSTSISELTRFFSNKNIPSCFPTDIVTKKHFMSHWVGTGEAVCHGLVLEFSRFFIGFQSCRGMGKPRHDERNLRTANNALVKEVLVIPKQLVLIIFLRVA